MIDRGAELSVNFIQRSYMLEGEVEADLRITSALER